MSRPECASVTMPDAAAIAAAVAGDEDAFRSLTERYRRELHVYCYRMLGSFHDAEDALQETFLRAWRYRDTFTAQGTYRAWLYRIATNVCLTAARRRRSEIRIVGDEEVPYLTPYPDGWLDELEPSSGNPAAAYDQRESVQLAFLTAVQVLPPRQRAVLILRDVLAWPASEVADLLEGTTASVNSALQRARATLTKVRGDERRLRSSGPGDEFEDALVRRYVEAWEALDLDRLVGLLRADALLAMPPLGLRFQGHQAIARFFATTPYPGAMADMRLVPARANRQPAYGAYRREPAGQIYRPAVLVVLTTDGEKITSLTGFAERTLFPLFGLPPWLEPDPHSSM